MGNIKFYDFHFTYALVTLHSRYSFYHLIHSLGNKPMILALLVPCSVQATRMLFYEVHRND